MNKNILRFFSVGIIVLMMIVSAKNVYANNTFDLDQIIDVLFNGNIIVKDQISEVRDLFQNKLAEVSLDIQVISHGQLKLTYDKNKRETKVEGKKRFTVTNKGKNVIYLNQKQLNFRFSMNGDVNINQPNSRASKLFLIKGDGGKTLGAVAKNNFPIDSSQFSEIVFPIKPGKTSTFDINLEAKPEQMIPGDYNFDLFAVNYINFNGSIDTYQQINHANNKYGKSIYIVGENAVVDTSNSIKINFVEAKAASSKNVLYSGEKASLHGSGLSGKMAKGKILKVKLGSIEPKYVDIKIYSDVYAEFTVPEYSQESQVSLGLVDDEGNSFGNIDVRIIVNENKAISLTNLPTDLKNDDLGKCYEIRDPKNNWGYCCNLNNDSQDKSIWQWRYNSNWQKYKIYSCLDYNQKDFPMSEIKYAPISSNDNYSAVITNNLKVGDESNQVILAQEKLKGKGFFDGPITGFFGELTKKAVATFQLANGLEAVGEIGPKTRNLLNSLFGF
jgi:hypothetical protein